MQKNLFRKGIITGIIVMFIIGGLNSNIGASDFGPSSMGTTWYIDDDCPCPGDGSLSDPFCAIWQGIENATSGDVLSIASGEYYENIIIDKKLTLQWHGSDICGTDTGIPIINGGYKGCVIEIHASEVQIREIHITASGKTGRDAGIYLEGDFKHIKILDSKITDCFYGIWSHRVRCIDTLTYHEFSRNTIDNIEAQGILASFSDEMSILNNKITNCGYCGIFLHHCNKCLIEGNTCENNRHGIGIDVGVDNDITLNTLQNNIQWGFFIVSGNANTIKSNNFEKNGEEGQATFVEYCIFNGNNWINNYWGTPSFIIHIIWGVLRLSFIDIPWPRID